MKTTFLIFISSTIRAYEYPRIDGFQHTAEFKDVLDADGKPLGERYVYHGRELTLEEFNAAAARVFSPTFANEERSFQPLAIDPDAASKAKAKREAAEEAARIAAEEAAAAEEQRIADEEAEAAAAAKALAEKEAEEREAARKSKLAVEAHTRKLDAENAAEQKRIAAAEAKAPVARPAAPTIVGELPTPAFTLDGKNIMSGGVRVAGLFGDDKQLRIPSANADLRPAIEAWLATNPQ